MSSQIMSVPTRFLSYLVVAATCGLSGSANVLRQVHGRAITEHHGRIANAYLIARPSECESLFDFLTLFERPDIAAHVHFDGIYLLGSATDSATLQSVIRAHDVHALVRRANNALVLQQRALGYRSAVLVVTDTDERAMLARPIPGSPLDYVTLAQLLSTIPA